MKKNPLLKNIFICLVIAALYFLLSMPYMRLMFPDGMSELRFSGFLPMVSGLLFGPVGAFACALGNFLSDLTKSLDPTDLFGAVGVFLMGYLPYKLWHGLFSSRTREPAFFTTASSVLKYVLIALIASVCATSVAAIGGQLFHQFSFMDFFSSVVLQYFDLSILVGMLLFHLLTGYAGIKPHIPFKPYETVFHKRRYAADHVLWISIFALCAVLLALCSRSGTYGAFGSPEIDVLCVVLLCMIVALALLPMARSRKKTERPMVCRPVGGLQKQFMTGFLILLCAVLVFYIVTMTIHMFEENETGPVLWIYVLSNAAVASALMVVVLFVLLKWIETHVTQPICITSAYAGNFVKDAALSSESLAFPHTGNEIDELGGSVRHMTNDIHNYVRELKEKTAAEERLAVEMNTARGIQRAILPGKWRESIADIAANIEPAREVGGDFYDFCMLPGNKIFVAVADVSGKGISAALFMMRAKTLMNVWADLPTAEMMERLNEELAKQNDAMMFVTMFAGVIDCAAMTFAYVNAGHNPPIIFQNGTVTMLECAPDFVMGPMEGTRYTEHTMTVSHDFKLLLYTDGVTEAQNKAGSFLGEDRLMQAAKDALSRNMTAEETMHAIQKCVSEFSDGAQQADDITILCLSLE